MAVGKIDFKITADTTELKQAMAEASKSVADTASKTKSTGGIFSSIGNSIKGIGSHIGNTIGRLGKMAAAMTVFKAINSTLSLIGNSVQSAFDRMDTMYAFEKALARITGSSDSAKAALEQVNQVVLGTPYGLDTAARAVQGFANSNISIGDSVKYVTAWGDAVAAYGDGSDETFQRVTFQLQQMAAKGKVNLGDLKTAMEAGIPVLQIYADATGQSLDEVRDSISSASIDTNDFMDVMQDAFENGTANFAGIEGAAKQMGATWKGTFGNMKMATTRGVIAIINAIDEGLSNNGLLTIKEALAKWGSTLETGMNTLATKVTPAMNSIVETVKGAWPTIQSVFEAVKEIAGTTADKLLSAFKQVAPEVGDSFGKLANWVTTHMDTIETVISTVIDVATGIFLGIKDTIETVAPYFGKFADWVAKASDAVRDFLPEGTTLTDVVRQVTPYVLAAIAAFSGMKKVVGVAKTAIKGLTTVFNVFSKVQTFSDAIVGVTGAMAKLGPVGKAAVGVVKLFGAAVGKIFTGLFTLVAAHPVVAAIGVIIATIYILWNKCEWFRDGVKAVWEGIKSAWSAGTEAVKNGMASMGDWISDKWESVKQSFSNGKEHLSNAWSSIKDGISSAKDSFVNGFHSMVDTVSNAMQTVWNVIQVVFMTIGSFIEGIFTFIGSIVLAGWNVIKYLFQVSAAFLKEVWEAVWTSISNFVGPKLDAIKNFVSTAWDWIKDKTSTVWEGIKAFFGAFWDILVSIFHSFVDPIVQFVGTAWDTISTKTVQVWNDIKAFFYGLWLGMVGIVTTSATAIGNFVSEKWQWIKAITTTVFNAIKNVASNVWNSIKTAVSNVVSSMVNFVQSKWNMMKGITTTVFNAIKSSASNIWNSIKTSVVNVANSIKSGVTSAWNNVKSVSSSVWGAIKDDMTSKMQRAKDTVGNIINGVKGFFSNLHLRFPKIEMPALPHFSISGSFSLKPPSVPHLSVDWYETGGIATGASIVGIGENGDEAIVPLSNKSRMQPFAKAVSDMMNKGDDSNDSNTGNNKDNRKIVIEIPIYLDKKQFARATVPDLETEMNRRERYANRRSGIK